jgi:glycosyltransferase involved in cell wall biosynthesis
MGRAKALKLKNVEFVDPIPKEEIPGYLAAADVGVAILQPISMFETTYPNKVFDYMAAGRPTVLAIDGVIRKVIEEAQGGLFVHPGDPEALAHAVRTYRDDPKLRVSHGRNARSFVEARFQRSAQAVLMEEILQRARSQEPDGA